MGPESIVQFVDRGVTADVYAAARECLQLTIPLVSRHIGEVPSIEQAALSDLLNKMLRAVTGRRVTAKHLEYQYDALRILVRANVRGAKDFAIQVFSSRLSTAIQVCAAILECVQSERVLCRIRSVWASKAEEGSYLETACRLQRSAARLVTPACFAHVTSEIHSCVAEITAFLAPFHGLWVLMPNGQELDIAHVSQVVTAASADYQLVVTH